MHITPTILISGALAGCSAAAPVTPGASDGGALSYHDLFTRYFAPGTPGHCATAGCHADPGHNVWTCNDEQSCYEGMIDVRLLDPDDPAQSELIDPRRSPLTWINAEGGNMPFDAQGPNQEARDAIEAWIAGGAPRE